jgi:hypothetical protein
MSPEAQLRIAEFLAALARGFTHTPIEVTLFFAIIAAAVGIIILYVATQNRQRRREEERRASSIISRYIERLGLDEAETALLARLAHYLEPGDSSHGLLVNSHLFNACARRMARAELVPEQTLNALRLKLGFRVTEAEEAPSSTAELPPGATLLLVLEGGTRVRGSLLAQGAGAMLVKVPSDLPPLKRGAELTLHFHNSAGIFSFRTSVTDVAEDAVFLAHTSAIARAQRRRYCRRRQRIPVWGTPLADGGKRILTVLLDISGGGASLVNPRGTLKAGDRLELSLSTEAAQLPLAARVLRLSRDGKVANVSFESLSEVERNRLVGFIFGHRK